MRREESYCDSIWNFQKRTKHILVTTDFLNKSCMGLLKIVIRPRQDLSLNYQHCRQEMGEMSCSIFAVYFGLCQLCS